MRKADNIKTEIKSKMTLKCQLRQLFHCNPYEISYEFIKWCQKQVLSCSQRERFLRRFKVCRIMMSNNRRQQRMLLKSTTRHQDRLGQRAATSTQKRRSCGTLNFLDLLVRKLFILFYVITVINQPTSCEQIQRTTTTSEIGSPTTLALNHLFARKQTKAGAVSRHNFTATATTASPKPGKGQQQSNGTATTSTNLSLPLNNTNQSRLNLHDKSQTTRIEDRQFFELPTIENLNDDFQANSSETNTTTTSSSSAKPTAPTADSHQAKRQSGHSKMDRKNRKVNSNGDEQTLDEIESVEKSSYHNEAYQADNNELLKNPSLSFKNDSLKPTGMLNNDEQMASESRSDQINSLDLLRNNFNSVSEPVDFFSSNQQQQQPIISPPNDKRNFLNASLEAQSKLRDTLNQLHYNKTLALGRLEATESGMGQPSEMQNVNSLLPVVNTNNNERNNLNDYVDQPDGGPSNVPNRIHFVDNDKQQSANQKQQQTNVDSEMRIAGFEANSGQLQLVSVSPTKAPSQSVLYTNSPSGLDPLDTAADELHNQRHDNEHPNGKRQSIGSRGGPDYDSTDWGKRKSSASLSTSIGSNALDGQPPVQFSTNDSNEESLVASSNQQQTKTPVHGYEDIYTWTPAAGPAAYRAGAPFDFQQASNSANITKNLDAPEESQETIRYSPKLSEESEIGVVQDEVGANSNNVRLGNGGVASSSSSSRDDTRNSYDASHQVNKRNDHFSAPARSYLKPRGGNGWKDKKLVNHNNTEEAEAGAADDDDDDGERARDKPSLRSRKFNSNGKKSKSNDAKPSKLPMGSDEAQSAQSARYATSSGHSEIHDDSDDDVDSDGNTADGPASGKMAVAGGINSVSGKSSSSKRRQKGAAVQNTSTIIGQDSNDGDEKIDEVTSAKDSHEDEYETRSKRPDREQENSASVRSTRGRNKKRANKTRAKFKTSYRVQNDPNEHNSPNGELENNKTNENKIKWSPSDKSRIDDVADRHHHSDFNGNGNLDDNGDSESFGHDSGDDNGKSSASSPVNTIENNGRIRPPPIIKTVRLAAPSPSTKPMSSFTNFAQVDQPSTKFRDSLAANVSARYAFRETRSHRDLNSNWLNSNGNYSSRGELMLKNEWQPQVPHSLDNLTPQAPRMLAGPKQDHNLNRQRHQQQQQQPRQQLASNQVMDKQYMSWPQNQMMDSRVRQMNTDLQHLQQKQQNWSIVMLPYPKPPPDSALNYFSSAPTTILNGGTNDNNKNNNNLDNRGLGSVQFGNTGEASTLDSYRHQFSSPSPTSNGLLESTRQSNQRDTRDVPLQQQQRHFYQTDNNGNDLLTINLKTQHQVAVGPNQLFWEAAAREAVAQQQQQQQHPIVGKMPLSNAHLPPHYKSPSGMTEGSNANNNNLPMQMRRPMANLRMSASNQDPFAMSGSHTNGHAFAGSTLKGPQFAAALNSLRNFNEFATTVGHHYPAAQDFFFTANPFHSMDSTSSLGQLMAAAMPSSSFVAPQDQQSFNGEHSFGQHRPSNENTNNNQFLKKGAAGIISATLPLASPTSLSDPYGWPMGYGSPAAKTLARINHIAAPPAYMIPRDKLATILQASAPTRAPLKQQHQQPQQPVRQLQQQQQPQFDSLTGEKIASGDVDSMAPLMGSHSMLQPIAIQQFGGSPVTPTGPWDKSPLGFNHATTAMAPGPVLPMLPTTTTATSPAGANEQLVRPNVIKLTLSTRPPTTSAPSMRERIKQRLRLIRRNTNASAATDHQQEDNSSASGSEPKTRHKRGIVETFGRFLKNSTNSLGITIPFNVRRPSISNPFNSSLINRQRPAFSLFNSAESRLRPQVAAPNSINQLSNQNVTKLAMVDLFTTQQATRGNGATTTQTAFIPLLDTGNMIDNLETDLLAQALLFSRQQQQQQQQHQQLKQNQKTINGKDASQLMTAYESHPSAQYMLPTGSMQVASHASLSSPPTGGGQYLSVGSDSNQQQQYQNQWYQMPTGLNQKQYMAGMSALPPNYLESQLMAQLEAIATANQQRGSPSNQHALLEPPANEPGSTTLKQQQATNNQANHLSPSGARQRFKEFVKSSRKPLSKLIKMTNFGGASRDQEQQNKKNSSNTTGSNMNPSASVTRPSVYSAPIYLTPSSSLTQPSIAQQFNHLISPAIMLSHQNLIQQAMRNGQHTNAMDNFNQFAGPINEWLEYQQQTSGNINGNKHQQHPLLPLATHLNQASMSPYSFITSNRSPMVDGVKQQQQAASNLNVAQNQQYASVSYPPAQPTQVVRHQPNSQVATSTNATTTTTASPTNQLAGPIALPDGERPHASFASYTDSVAPSPVAINNWLSRPMAFDLHRLARPRLQPQAPQLRLDEANSSPLRRTTTSLEQSFHFPRSAIRRDLSTTGNSNYNWQQQPTENLQHQSRQWSSGTVNTRQPARLSNIGGNSNSQQKQPAQFSTKPGFRFVSKVADHQQQQQQPQQTMTYSVAPNGQPKSEFTLDEFNKFMSSINSNNNSSDNFSQTTANSRPNQFTYSDAEIYPSPSDQQPMELASSHSGMELNTEDDASKLLAETNVADSAASLSLNDQTQPFLSSQTIVNGGDSTAQLQQQQMGATLQDHQVIASQQQQQQQLFFPPTTGGYMGGTSSIFSQSGSLRPRPRLPKFSIPSINSFTNKFRQHLLQTFRLNPLGSRWPNMLASPATSFMSLQAPQQQQQQQPAQLDGSANIFDPSFGGGGTSLTNQMMTFDQAAKLNTEAQQQQQYIPMQQPIRSFVGNQQHQFAANNFHQIRQASPQAAQFSGPKPMTMSQNQQKFISQQQQQPIESSQFLMNSAQLGNNNAANQSIELMLPITNGDQTIFDQDLGLGPVDEAQLQQDSLNPSLQQQQQQMQTNGTHSAQPMKQENPSHNVMIDVSGSLITSDGTYIQEDQAAEQRQNQRGPTTATRVAANSNSFRKQQPQHQNYHSANHSSHEVSETNVVDVSQEQQQQQQQNSNATQANDFYEPIMMRNESGGSSEQSQPVQAITIQMGTDGSMKTTLADGQQHESPYVEMPNVAVTGADAATGGDQTVVLEEPQQQQQQQQQHPEPVVNQNEVVETESQHQNQQFQQQMQQQQQQFNQMINTNELNGQHYESERVSAASRPKMSSSFYAPTVQTNQTTSFNRQHQQQPGTRFTMLRQQQQQPIRIKLQKFKQQPKPKVEVDYQVIKASNSEPQSPQNSIVRLTNGTVDNIARQLRKLDESSGQEATVYLSQQDAANETYYQQHEQFQHQQQPPVSEFPDGGEEQQQLITNGLQEPSASSWQQQQPTGPTAAQPGQQQQQQRQNVGQILHGTGNQLASSSPLTTIVEHHRLVEVPVESNSFEQNEINSENNNQQQQQHHQLVVADSPASLQNQLENLNSSLQYDFRPVNSSSLNLLDQSAAGQNNNRTFLLAASKPHKHHPTTMNDMNSTRNELDGNYVLIDQPVIVSGASSFSDNQLGGTSKNYIEQPAALLNPLPARPTTTSLVNELGRPMSVIANANSTTSTMPEQPAVFVSITPERVVTQQQQQPHQSVSMSSNQANRKRPLKMPKRGQSSSSLNRSPTSTPHTDPLLSSQDQRTSESTLNQMRTNSRPLELSGLSPNASSSSSTSTTTTTRRPELPIRHRGGPFNQSSVDLNGLKNHNLRASTVSPQQMSATITRDSFTRPPKAKIRWQGATSSSSLASNSTGGKRATPSSGDQAISPSELNQNEQAWIVGGMTHQAFAGNGSKPLASATMTITANSTVQSVTATAYSNHQPAPKVATTTTTIAPSNHRSAVSGGDDHQTTRRDSRTGSTSFRLSSPNVAPQTAQLANTQRAVSGSGGATNLLASSSPPPDRMLSRSDSTTMIGQHHHEQQQKGTNSADQPTKSTIGETEHADLVSGATEFSPTIAQILIEGEQVAASRSDNNLTTLPNANQQEEQAAKSRTTTTRAPVTVRQMPIVSDENLKPFGDFDELANRNNNVDVKVGQPFATATDDSAPISVDPSAANLLHDDDTDNSIANARQIHHRRPLEVTTNHFQAKGTDSVSNESPDSLARRHLETKNSDETTSLSLANTKHTVDKR